MKKRWKMANFVLKVPSNLRIFSISAASSNGIPPSFSLFLHTKLCAYIRGDHINPYWVLKIFLEKQTLGFIVHIRLWDSSVYSGPSPGVPQSGGPVILELPVDKIRRPLMRTRANDPRKVQELMDSIREIGLQVPVSNSFPLFVWLVWFHMPFL